MSQPYIGISSITSDTAGNIMVPWLPGSDFGTSERRVSRTKTLDGGVILSDGGWTTLDRDVTIITRYSEDALTVLQHLHEDKTLVHISLSDGYFKGTIKRLRSTEGEIKITIWLSEKLSE